MDWGKSEQSAGGGDGGGGDGGGDGGGGDGGGDGFAKVTGLAGVHESVGCRTSHATL